MRTPEQWFEYWKANDSITLPAVVKLAQADALRHAAAICGDQIPDGYASTCQELIEAEADKLECK